MLDTLNVHACREKLGIKAVPSRFKKKAEENDLERWRPRFKCYCCEDQGYILPRYVPIVIEDHAPRDLDLTVCNRRDCFAGQQKRSLSYAAQMNTNISPEVCEHFHQDNLAKWEEWRKKDAHLAAQRAQENQQMIQEFAQSFVGAKYENS